MTYTIQAPDHSGALFNDIIYSGKGSLRALRPHRGFQHFAAALGGRGHRPFLPLSRQTAKMK